MDYELTESRLICSRNIIAIKAWRVGGEAECSDLNFEVLRVFGASRRS